ncbi:MAG: glycosyltransferase family 2 protein [Kiritimatiellae bacterium]|nr:glycosyltransferase family 2 protein [Kiritimatiellia bacterium]
MPTFNRSAVLTRCLKALIPQVCDMGRDAEIIVVDDGSSPREAERIAALAASPGMMQIALCRHPVNRGVGAARNTGAGKAAGGVIIFLDDDLAPGPGFVRGHLEVHLENPQILLLCGHLFTNARSMYARFWAHCYEQVFARRQDTDPFPVPMLSSGNFSIRRAGLDLFRPLFDPELPSREDFDLYLRARDAGHMVYKTMRAGAELFPRETLPAFAAQRRWYAEGEIRLRQKYGRDTIMAAEEACPIQRTVEMRMLDAAVRMWNRIASRRTTALNSRGDQG